MFIWRVDTVLKAIQMQMPDLFSKLEAIADHWDLPDAVVVKRIWPTIQPQTIDYGIMEGAKNVAVIPTRSLEWSDVGSWDALYDLLPADENGNHVKGGRLISFGSKNNLVFSDLKRMFVSIGVDDLILVDTGDILMVCDRKQAQRVREVVDFLKKNEDYHYL
jgi:mannose-1-phosphate guanylyltransferase